MLAINIGVIVFAILVIASIVAMVLSNHKGTKQIAEDNDLTEEQVNNLYSKGDVEIFKVLNKK